MGKNHAIETLRCELKSLKRQRDVFIFQESCSMRYSGEEIGELEVAIKKLKEGKEEKEKKPGGKDHLDYE